MRSDQTATVDSQLLADSVWTVGLRICSGTITALNTMDSIGLRTNRPSLTLASSPLL